MFKSKTIWFSIALAVLSVLQGFVVQLPVPPEAQALVGAIIAAFVAYLRFQTKEPISDK